MLLACARSVRAQCDDVTVAARQFRARVVGDEMVAEPRTREKCQQHLQLEIEHLTKARYHAGMSGYAE